MFITLRNQFLKLLILLACLVFLSLHLALPINLTAVDIGRHIKNGELILHGNLQVLHENYYSYTYKSYPFINHHWFFGVISYILYRLSGFDGLSVFYILLLMATFLLSFDSARRYSSFYMALFFAMISFIMLISRAEIRPEGCSVFFVALDFWLLQRFLQKEISARILIFTIPFIQLIWVNTHIFFPLGIVLVGLFLWQANINKEDKSCTDLLKLVFTLTVAACLINPSGLWGMLTPLNGFKKFGYDLAENQSVFFMIHRFGDNVTYKYFIFAAAILLIGMIMAVYREKLKVLPVALLSGFIVLVTFKAVRLIMPFGFLFIPLSAYFYGPILKGAKINFILGLISAVGIILYFWLMPIQPQIGLMPRVNASAEFYKLNGLKGPIFSNYDIGGYLIYHLQNQEKVFVDNRQEAFPVDFFRKVYIPMQEDPVVWDDLKEKYKFNIIYFYRHDITPWGQAFLIDRIQDPKWAPVFVDDYAIIFARRGSLDQEIIDHFELPKNMFRVTKN